jgi:hypothetical protein
MAPEPPDSAQARALSSWARAHGVRLAAPERAAAHPLAVDPGIAENVEVLLESARDAIAAHEGAGADRALSTAESMLRAHPELPQAAWLMAEVDRERAAQWRRVPPTDAEAAEAAWLRAEAIDDGRVAGVGEEASANHPRPATVTVDLSPEDAQLWLDGEPVRPSVIPTRSGVHTLVATSGGAPVWAGWIEARPGATSVRVDAPTAPKCSADDVARARITSDANGRSSVDLIDAHQVRCSSWVASLAGTQLGSVRVAVCETDRCGPLFEWRASTAWTWAPPVEHGKERRGPSWATWSLLGVGVAIAAGVVLAASGALETAPAETHFVSGGIKKQ